MPLCVSIECSSGPPMLFRDCTLGTTLAKVGVYLRWKRSDESSAAAKPKFELPIHAQHFFQIISYPYVISFFVGFFIACLMHIVIFSLT